MQCIFSRIPKTASTSTLRAIASDSSWHQVSWVNSPNDFDLNHIPLPFIKEAMKEKKYNNFFKFSFVRNPWERAHSQYRYVFQWNKGKESGGEFEGLSFQDFIHRLGDPSAQWYSKTRWAQAFYCQGVDFVGRFENLQEDYKKMREMWWTFQKKSKRNLRHQNKNRVKPKTPYRDAYTEDMKKIVAKKYEEDIDLFKYTF